MTSLEELAARFDRLEQTVEALDEASAWDAPAASTASGPSVDTVGSAGPVCADVEEWVDLVFRPTFSRSFGGDLRWCVQWQEHDEAVLRLEALWRAWEQLRLDPTMGHGHVATGLPRSAACGPIQPTRYVRTLHRRSSRASTTYRLLR